MAGGLGWRDNVARRLSMSPTLALAWPTVFVALSYFPVYTYRYPIFLLTESDLPPFELGGAGLKAWASIALVLGMALSKIPGVLYVSQLPRSRRLVAATAMYLGAAVCITAFWAVFPPVLILLSLFLGAFPAGWIFGTLLQYLEGRLNMEIMNTGLHVVIVFGSGAARAIGSWLLASGSSSSSSSSSDIYDSGSDGNAISSSSGSSSSSTTTTIVTAANSSSLLAATPLWMPAVAAAAFAPLFAVAIVALDATPEPSQADMRARTKRQPMTNTAKLAFLRRHAFGLALVLTSYALLLATRTFRDYFAMEIYTGALARPPTASEFLLADWPGGVLACILLASLSCVRDSRRALLLMLGMMMVGAAVMLMATLAFKWEVIGALPWMSGVGVGIFVAVTPFSGALFDRLMAATRTVGTSVFLVFIGDGTAYVGTVSLLMYKSFGQGNTMDYLGFFTNAVVFVAVVMIAATTLAMAYFARAVPLSGGSGDGVGNNNRGGGVYEMVALDAEEAEAKHKEGTQA